MNREHKENDGPLKTARSEESLPLEVSPPDSPDEAKSSPPQKQEETPNELPPPATNEKSPAERPPPTGNRPKPTKYYRRFVKTNEDEGDSIYEKLMYFISLILAIVFFPLALFICMAVVKEYHRLVVFRLGRVRKGIRGPGITWVLPCIDTWMKVDLRTNCEVVPSQDILTKDSVTIRVDAVLYYCIYSPMDAVIQVANVHESTIMIAQTTLRTIVGSKSLIELLTSREALSREIGQVVDGITDRWGVRVERVELKDIRLPDSLQRSLASEAEAHREARAKIISAEGELKASQALKDASDVMAENKIILQLRHLQILTSIASERKCHIIYPIPMEIMQPFVLKSEADTDKLNEGDDGGLDTSETSFSSKQNKHPIINTDTKDFEDNSKPKEDFSDNDIGSKSKEEFSDNDIGSKSDTDKAPLPVARQTTNVIEQKRSENFSFFTEPMPLHPEQTQTPNGNNSNSNNNPRSDSPVTDSSSSEETQIDGHRPFFFFDQTKYRALYLYFHYVCIQIIIKIDLFTIRVCGF